MGLSSFFDANYPQYAALLSGGGLNINSLVQVELGRVFVTCRGNTLWDSGDMGLNNLTSFEHRVWVRDRPCRPVLWFTYTRWVNAYPIRSTTRVGVAVNNGYLPVSSRTVPYTLLVSKARRTISRRIYSPKAREARVSAPLRPSPEIVQLPVRRVVESNFSGGVPTITLGLRDLTTRSWSGVRTPNFKKLKPRQYPVNNHTVDAVYIPSNDNTEWAVNSSQSGWSYVVDRYTTFYGVPGGPIHSNQAENKAIKRLIDKASSSIDANLAQDFAQIGQTTRLVAGTATKIAGSVKALKRGNLTLAANLLFAGRNPKFRGKGPSITKSVAENWLELQYGWKPLLQDIHGSFEALSKLNEDESFVHRVMASATVQTDENYTFPVNVLPSSAGNHKSLILTRSSCRIVVRYRIESPLKSFLAQTGFTNPINLVWEILPWSFVLDWFIPIGPYLETLSAWDGLTFMDGARTRFTRQNVATVINYSGLSPVNPQLVLHGHGAYAREWVKLSREKLFQFPTMNLPSFKNGLASVDHALNGLALLRSAFK